MGLTDREVSPHMVERLAAEWTSQTVYVVPVGMNADNVPVVKLIQETGRLLEV